MAAKKDTTPKTPGPASDKKQALETALAQIEKQFGKGTVMKLGANIAMQVDAIPTGSLGLDLALVSAVCPAAVSSRSTAPNPLVKLRWLCTSWPKPRRWAARSRSSTLSMRWTPCTPPRWA